MHKFSRPHHHPFHLVFLFMVVLVSFLFLGRGKPLPSNDIESKIFRACGSRYIAHCIYTEAVAHGLDPWTMACICYSESGYNPDAYCVHWEYFTATNNLTNIRLSNKNFDRGLYQLHNKSVAWVLTNGFRQYSIAHRILKNPANHLYDEHLNAYIACKYYVYLVRQTGMPLRWCYQHKAGGATISMERFDKHYYTEF